MTDEKKEEPKPEQVVIQLNRRQRRHIMRMFNGKKLNKKKQIHLNRDQVISQLWQKKEKES